MIIGIGTDIMQKKHIAEDYVRGNVSFFTRAFTGDEQKQAQKRSDPARYFAGRFAAKEAVFKCFGGDNKNILPKEIEILSSEDGKPQVTLFGECLKIAERAGVRKIHVSISNDGDYVSAFAVAEA